MAVHLGDVRAATSGSARADVRPLPRSAKLPQGWRCVRIARGRGLTQTPWSRDTDKCTARAVMYRKHSCAPVAMSTMLKRISTPLSSTSTWGSALCALVASYLDDVINTGHEARWAIMIQAISSPLLLRKSE